MFALNGKTAFVSGGTAGIGRAVAGNFVESGAKVMIAGRREEGAEVAREIGASFCRLDVADESAVKQAMQVVKQKLGGLDILVANAGVATDDATIENTDTEQIRRVFDINVLGVVWCIKYALPVLNDNASIVVTSSLAAKMGFPGEWDYAASKAAVANIVMNAAIQLGERGIRVNGVCPGGIQTDMALPAVIFETCTPIKRMGTTADVVGIYNLLASDAGSYITGQNINVDGGVSAGFTTQLVEKIFS